MTPREAFLDELRERTRIHLDALASESAETFGRYIALPKLGEAMYRRLVEQFQMDGAQEIAATIVDLFAGRLESGTIMVSEREYRGLKLVLDEFGADLPDAPHRSLRELITTLARSDRA